MPHPNEIANGGLATQYVFAAQASGVIMLAANSRRIAFTISPGAPIRLGYPSAVASQSFPVASGAVFEERDYKGDVRAILDTGGPANVWVTDVILP